MTQHPTQGRIVLFRQGVKAIGYQVWPAIVMNVGRGDVLDLYVFATQPTGPFEARGIVPADEDGDSPGWAWPPRIIAPSQGVAPPVALS